MKRSMEQLTEPRKFETAIVENYDYLRCVVMAIDLSRTDIDEDAVVEQATKPGEVRDKDFLRFCARLQMRSVLGDPIRFLTPFKRAWKLGQRR
jgi:hypothetical protein